MNHDQIDRELDRLLTTAYRDRDASVGEVRPHIGEVTVLARRRQRRHRTAVGVVTTLLVLVGVVGITWSLRRPDADSQVETAVSAPPASPRISLPPSTPDDVDQPNPGPGAEWYGPVGGPDPDVTSWSALEVETPGWTPGARQVVELRRNDTDDWRDQPAAAAVLIDRPATELVPRNGKPISFGDRAGFRADYGASAQAVVSVDGSRSIRISGRGLDAGALDLLATTARVDGDRIVWPGGVPGGLHVLHSQPVRGPTFHVRTLTYTKIPDPAQRMLGSVKIAVRSTDDPVEIAENAVSQAGFDSSVVRRRDVAGRPAIVAGNQVQWRDGDRQFLVSEGMLAPGSELVDRLADSVRPLRTDEVAALVVAHTTSSGPKTTNQQPAYPISPDAAVRTERFRNHLPAGFPPFDGDGPEEDGVLARAYGNDRWISLSLAPTTVGPPAMSTEPTVFNDLGWSRAMLWHSPSGWSYELTVTDKAAVVAPMSVDQMFALLRYVDTGTG